MGIMRNIALFIFVLIFAVNTVSLSAYASSCTMMMKSSAMEETCHDMNEDKAQTATHCEGICLCQNVLLSSHILPFDMMNMVVVSLKDVPPVSFENPVYSYATAPPFRPPITIS